jgi:hypothetical protein
VKKIYNKLKSFNNTLIIKMATITPSTSLLPNIGPLTLDNPIITKEEFNSLPSNRLDCDWAAFSIYTSDWLKLIGPLSVIQLLSHKPACRDNVNKFSNWVYIGTGTGYIKVPPQYKTPIINAIKEYGIQLLESKSGLVLISGNQHIMGYDLGKILLGNNINLLL